MDAIPLSDSVTEQDELTGNLKRGGHLSGKPSPTLPPPTLPKARLTQL